jgi:hypothetical protein
MKPYRKFPGAFDDWSPAVGVTKLTGKSSCMDDQNLTVDRLIILEGEAERTREWSLTPADQFP